MTQPPPTTTLELLARLDCLGSYSFHRPSFLGRWIGVPAEIEWESPIGYENDLAPMGVTLWIHGGGRSADDDLRRLLDEVGEFRGRLQAWLAALRRHLVECFRTCYERGLPNVDRQRLSEAGGAIDDAAILREVQSIRLRFDATRKSIVRTAWIAVGWDEEHGVDVEWDEAGEIVRPWRNVGDQRR